MVTHILLVEWLEGLATGPVVILLTGFVSIGAFEVLKLIFIRNGLTKTSATHATAVAGGSETEVQIFA